VLHLEARIILSEQKRFACDYIINFSSSTK
jgi:hypothetical protein